MVFGYSVCFVSFLFLFIFGLISVFSGVCLLLGDLSVFLDWEVLCINGSSVTMTILFDWMSLIFLGFVMFISSMVIMYSEGYMSGDINIVRFILVVLLFVMSMGLLILSPNLISILLGWDGLGLVSYALVIYYQNVRSANAGMLTALSNRVGDVALLLGICLMSSWGSWEFPFYLESFSGDFLFYFVVGLVMLAAFTSSAQIPFSAWLPAAMAAPTPVSALVHSSTLVTAGVYLLIRFSPALLGSFYQSILLFISGVTMFMSGLGANFENDLKKVIALSTLSQLGVMLFSLSIGLASVAFFHLLTHALFKSLLFLCAGVVIHNVKDFQDIRSMGGLSGYLPVTVSCFNVSNLALCGMPFLAGFYSSDLILEVCSMSVVNWFSFVLVMLSTGLTVCYSLRLAFVSMFGDYNMGGCSSVTDEVEVMTWPMMGLTLMAVIGGALLSWVLFPCPSMVCLPLFLKMGVLIVSLIGGSLGLLLSMVGRVKGDAHILTWHRVSSFSGSMWFMPGISTRGVITPWLVGGEHFYHVGDMGWSEYFGAQGIHSSLGVCSVVNQFMQSNILKFYLFTLGIWFMVLLVVF
uniref:NADH-ubiquinone oxidoreductase chain 5 n=1 Tax=Occasjapyx japonicus TaxID=289462 RepID=U3KTI6_9HEXA|nr:NADH dehydrogenase subunit 5 [Occasjapyx japonicus]AEV44867.1 NADH dehydrogenase subunit 5 [Occasjapyx japonicus]